VQRIIAKVAEAVLSEILRVVLHVLSESGVD